MIELGSIEEVRQLITEWKEMNHSYMKEIKWLASEAKKNVDLRVISYFTYSLNVQHEMGFDNFALGSYHIQNVGEKPLTNLYICLKVSPNNVFDFSGKYVYKDSKQKMKLANAWKRINDPTDKQEFWLKPIQSQALNPTETLSFANFQVKWNPQSSYTGSMMGFTYGDEIEGGMEALNHINISGKVEGDDESE